MVSKVEKSYNQNTIGTPTLWTKFLSSHENYFQLLIFVFIELNHFQLFLNFIGAWAEL